MAATEKTWPVAEASWPAQNEFDEGAHGRRGESAYRAGFEAGFAAGFSRGCEAKDSAVANGAARVANNGERTAEGAPRAGTKKRGLLGLPCTRCNAYFDSTDRGCPYCGQARDAALNETA